MSEIYTVSAKTVDEAMELASKLYGGNNKEISYDIVSLPKKGFLGIGSKDAVIRVTVSDEEDAGLSSIVNEIKSYKSKTAPETGYYTPEAEKIEKAEKTEKAPEIKKEKKPEPKKEGRDNPVKAAPTEKKEPAEKKQNTQKDAQKKPQQPKAETKKPQQQPKKQQPKPEAKKEEKPIEKAEPQKSTDNEKKRAVSREEMDFAKSFINSMIADMNLSATAIELEAAEGEDFITAEGLDVYPAINIVGDDTGILIGHHGETLDAVQYLVNLALVRRANSKGSGRENIKITVDIENYRAKREETLRSLARRMAARAVKYKKNVFLEPMNPYERRIIHSELQEYPDVSTHSVGSDTNRKIIITYEGADKAPQNKRRRNGRRPSRTESVKETSAEPTTPVAIPLPSLDDIDA